MKLIRTQIFAIPSFSGPARANVKKANIQSALGLCLGISMLSMSLIGCGSDSDSSVAPQPMPFQGVWEREGYGDVYTVGASGGSTYQYTRSTCLQVDDADNSDIAEFFDGAKLSDNGASLTLGEKSGGAFPVKLSKRSALPAQCEDDRLITDATPTRTFEHFAQTYADYYAFFSERNIDWNSRVAKAQTLVSDNMSNDELFEVLSSLLEPLDDGHVQLIGNGHQYRPAQMVGANQIVVAAFEQQTEYTDLQTYANQISANYWENIGDYLDEGSVETFDGVIPDRLIWGTMGNGTVGYLYIASMAYLSEENDGLDQVANALTMQTVMANAMDDLRDTQAIIIDVRKNFGGHDTVSKVVASHFVGQRSLYGSKLARSYMGDTATVEAFIEPVESPYLNPVAVIAGVETASAAESFTLAMKAQPQVTLVGENTNGILSDVLEKTLPNGWKIWLANEVYFDHLGVNYEVIGIPADVEAPVFSLEAIAAGYNAAIDAALQVLGY